MTEFKKLRKETGMTQKQAAELLLMSKRSIENYDQGRRKPSKLILKTMRDQL